MATPTYTAIASITLGSSASSVTFSSIPQDYRDLVLVFSGEGSVFASYEILLNEDASNGSQVYMRGDGSSPFSTTDAKLSWLFGAQQTTAILQVFDYSATDKHKSTLQRSGNPADFVYAAVGRYASTSAITSIEIGDVGSATFAAGSTVSLYGIEA